MPSIADVFVTVLPETKKIADGIREAFVRADPIAREAGQRWGREIQTGIGTVKVDIDADTAKAEAKIDAVGRDRKATVEVDADTLGSSVERGIEQGGLSGIGALQPALLGVGGTMLAGIASALSGLAGLMPAGLLGAGGVVGTLVTGLSGVKEAWDAAGKAADSSGSDQAAKAKDVANAQRSLTDATQSQNDAQRDLSNAWKDARQQLDDLNLSLQGGKISEAQAYNDVLKARRDLAQGGFKDQLDYNDAQLRVASAEQRWQESKQRNTELQSKANDENAKGVAGSDLVVNAQERVARANEQAAVAQQNLNDANAKTSSSAQAAVDAMAKLSPNAQAFVTTLQQMKPQFEAFKNSIQDSLFAGLGPQFQQLATTYMPMLQTFMGGMAQTMNQAFGQVATFLQNPQTMAAMQTIFANIGQSFTVWMQAMQPFEQAFLNVTQAGSAYLPQLASMAGQVGDAFLKWTQSGALDQWIQTGMTALQQLGGILGQLLPMFLNLAPIGTASLGAIQSLLAGLQGPIALLAPAFANMVQNGITPMINLLSRMITQEMPQTVKFVETLTTDIGGLTTAFSGLWGVMSPLLDKLGEWLNRFINPLTTLSNVVDGLKNLFGGHAGGITASAADNLQDAINAKRAQQGLPPIQTPGGYDPTTGAPSSIPGAPSFPGFTTPAGIGSHLGLQTTGGGWGPGTNIFANPTAAAPGLNWDALAQSEAGGNWANKSNPKYMGGLQFDQQTWDAFKPAGAPSNPADASKEQQIAAAQNAINSGRTPQSLWPQNYGQLYTGGASMPTMPSSAAPVMPTASGAYGLPTGTDTGGYGSSGPVFPDWVHQIEQTFGVKASTYSGHQETDRQEAGYAPNPTHENRGIDWSGTPQAMQQFADYLKTVAPDLEQVIWNGAGIGTGDTVEIAGGRPQPGYFAGDLAGHGNHVHTRQSMPIPLPGMPNMTGMPGGSAGDPMFVALPDTQVDKMSNSPASQLGQDFLGGILQEFGLDGSVFGNPMNSGAMKFFKGAMGLKFAGSDGASQADPSGTGGGGGSIFGGLLQGIIPGAMGPLQSGSPTDGPGQFMPLMPGSGGGAVSIPQLATSGARGAPGPGNDQSLNVTINGNVGRPQDLQQPLTDIQVPAVRQGVRHLPS